MSRLPLRKLALALTSVVVALLLVEVGMRVRQYLKYGSVDRLNTFVTHEPSGLRMPVPSSDQGGVRVDSNSFRSPEIEEAKPANRTRIAFLGGSTTYCAEVTPNEKTWPYLVTEALRKDFPQADIDFLNASVVGFTTERSLQNLEHRVRQFDPDVVVIYHATNDLTRFTRRLAEDAGVWKESMGEESWLARHSVAWRILSRNLVIQARSEKPEAAGTLEYELPQIVEPFRASLTELTRAAKAVADEVVLVTFSPRLRAEQNTVERATASQTSLYYMPYMTTDTLLAGFEAYNDVIREVAAAESVVLSGDEHAIPGDATHYNDSVHLTEQGCEALAERVTKAMRDAPTIRALLGAK